MHLINKQKVAKKGTNSAKWQRTVIPRSDSEPKGLNIQSTWAFNNRIIVGSQGKVDKVTGEVEQYPWKLAPGNACLSLIWTPTKSNQSQKDKIWIASMHIGHLVICTTNIYIYGSALYFGWFSYICTNIYANGVVLSSLTVTHTVVFNLLMFLAFFATRKVTFPARNVRIFFNSSLDKLGNQAVESHWHKVQLLSDVVESMEV